MSPTATKLLAEVLKLDPSEREALAEEALRSLSPFDQQSIDAAWLAEVLRRDSALKSGMITAAPLADVVARFAAKDRK
jgi:putative addiction module component (TIGR02574 family)